jgi:hypothetical protein
MRVQQDALIGKNTRTIAMGVSAWDNFPTAA